VLYQLSYTHHSGQSPSAYTGRDYLALVARQKGLEPLTCDLEGRCSIHLSYWRKIGTAGFEPATPCAQDRCATKLRYAPSIKPLTYRRTPLNRTFGRRIVVETPGHFTI
jgi:hypothetical protein